ncbi:hypothetical protein D1872_256140 [compost metagenome]
MYAPRSGPNTLDSPNTAPNKPPSLPLASGATTSNMIVNAIGTKAPAPIPCTARYIVSSTIDVAVPHKADPSINTNMPNTKNFLRPYMSDNLPKIGMPAISATM